MQEIVGHTGVFDYVEFVGEYAPYDLYALENLGRAVDLFPHLSAMMKIEQEPRTYLSVRAIGSGIQNLLFADPRTVEDVEECVRAVRAESPATGGIHGVGMRRDVGFVLEAGTPAFVQALEDAVVAIMIEKDSAVENLADLLSVKGVDMVQFGPADYSMSIGLTGQTTHPRVKEAAGIAMGRGICNPAADEYDGNQDVLWKAVEEDHPSWRATQSALEDLERFAKSNGIKVVGILIPELHDLSPNSPFVPLYNTVVARFEEIGIPLIDPFPELTDTFGSNFSAAMVAVGDPHPNVSAHRVIAKNLVQYLTAEPAYLPAN